MSARRSAAIGALVLGFGAFGLAVIVAALALSSAWARAAFRGRADLTHATAPQRPVLFFNPKSGGGKAERFSLADEARARGIEPIARALALIAAGRDPVTAPTTKED